MNYLTISMCKGSFQIQQWGHFKFNPMIGFSKCYQSYAPNVLMILHVHLIFLIICVQVSQCFFSV